MSVILGKNIILQVLSSGVYIPVAVGRDVTLTINRAALEKTSTESGKYREFLKGKIDHTLDISGLASIAGSGFTMDMLYNEITGNDAGYLYYKFIVQDDFFTVVYSGKGVMTTMPMKRTYNEAATYDVTIQGSGIVASNKTGSSYPYFWLISDSPLTAGAAASLITASGANEVYANSNDTINILWSAFTPKYLVFSIPSTSALKTSFYVDDFDQAGIGDAYSLFGAPVVENITDPFGQFTGVPYNIYISNWPTITNNSIMQLRN